MGVGKVTLCSRLSGEHEITQGIGEAELILFGVKEDYRVHIDKGVGNAFVDGTPAASDTKYGNGPAEVEIDGGIGTIRVSFSKQKCGMKIPHFFNNAKSSKKRSNGSILVRRSIKDSTLR